MERLTERRDDGSVVIATKCPEWCEYATCSMEEGYQCQHQCEGDIMQRLADYEDAEEQGLLLRLPCKVGDTVYSVVADGRQIIELRFCLEFYVVRKNDFGKTVFLTREEAEKALADMGV